MSTTRHQLASADFFQDWSNTGLITTNDNWDAVPSIVGYRGDNLTSGVDPQTVVADGGATPVNILANQPAASSTSGGLGEFGLADPAVGLQGSGTADAPHLVIYLDATGRQNLHISYTLRDLDGSADNAVQPVALQYRIGGAGDFINVPAAFIADATTGPSLATLTTTVSVDLPAAVNDAAQLELRIITTNASGNDEWVGIDDIQVTSQAIPAGPTGPALTYVGQFNESQAFDGSVAGKITIELSGGETFADLGADMLAVNQASIANLPSNLTATLTRIDATTAELTLTGTAANHTNAYDLGNLTITFADSAFAGGSAAAVANATKADLAIDFGDPGTAGDIQTFTPYAGTTQDSSDASTAIALDANWMVVGDDEANALRVYSRAGGAAVKEWSFASDLGLGTDELDLEAGTRIGDTLYFIGSHSNASAGTDENNREHIFAVTISGSGVGTTFSDIDQYGGLEGALAAWDSSNAHGLGANYFGLAASSANGLPPEAVDGFSIEGMTASQDGSNLLLGFRAPQEGASTRHDALIIPVTVASIFPARLRLAHRSSSTSVAAAFAPSKKPPTAAATCCLQALPAPPAWKCRRTFGCTSSATTCTR